MENLIESFGCFSKSEFWNMHHKFYRSSGVQAWSKFGIPSYLTSSPLATYNVLSVVHDILSCMILNGEVCINKHVCVLDIGCGSGRFGYTFLKQYERMGLPVKLKYIFLDCSEDNINFVRNHRSLTEFFDSNIAHAHVLDVMSDWKESLNIILEEYDYVNPPIVIANYLFDSLPQDVFVWEGGSLVSADVEFKCENKLDFFSGCRLSVYSGQYVDTCSFYSSDDWNKALFKVSNTLKNVDFCMPVGAFFCIDQMVSLFGSKLILICSDQGSSEPFTIMRNGAMCSSSAAMGSISVNYLALHDYLNVLGFVHIDVRNDSKGMLCSLVASTSNISFISKQIGLGDLFNLSEAALSSNMLDMDCWLSLMNISCFDPSLIFSTFSFIKGKFKYSSRSEKTLYLSVLNVAYENFFPISDQDFLLLSDFAILFSLLGCASMSVNVTDILINRFGPLDCFLRNREIFIGMSSDSEVQKV